MTHTGVAFQKSTLEYNSKYLMILMILTGIMSLAKAQTSFNQNAVPTKNNVVAFKSGYLI